MNAAKTLSFGLFMQPLYPSRKAFGLKIAEDVGKVERAEQCGLAEAWTGEHFSGSVYSVTNNRMFLSYAAARTKQIKLGAGVLNLPFYHPVEVAVGIAMLDHLSGGRLMVGIGGGGLQSDQELYGLQDGKSRMEKMFAALEVVRQIWCRPPPWTIDNGHYRVGLERQLYPELGIGSFPEMVQRPHPPLALAASSGASHSARLAGENGWMLLSAHFAPLEALKRQWETYQEGAGQSGRFADPTQWRVVRSVFVAETDAAAERFVMDPASGTYRHFEYELGLLRHFNAQHKIGAGAETKVTHLLEDLVIFGSPKTVNQKLTDLRSRTGPFSTTLMLSHEHTHPEEQEHSMALAGRMMSEARRAEAADAPEPVPGGSSLGQLRPA